VRELLRAGRAFDRPHGDLLHLRVSLFGLLLQAGKLLGLIFHGAFQGGDLCGQDILLAIRLAAQHFFGGFMLLFEPGGCFGW